MRKLSLLITILLCMADLAAPQTPPKPAESPKSVKDSSVIINAILARAIQTGIKDTAAAENLFRQVISKALRDKNDYLAGRAFYEMGEMYSHNKNHNRSFGSFFNAREHFTNANARKEIARTLFGLGREQYFRGNYKVSAGHLNYAMREAKELKLPGLEAESLEYLGILYHIMPTIDHQSDSYFRKSLLIKEKLKDSRGALRMLEKLGDYYYDERQFDSAFKYSNRSIDMALKLQLFYDADLSKLNRIPVFIRLGKLPEAEKELNLFATSNRDSGDLNTGIRYHIQKGNYLVAVNQLAAARQEYDLALKVADRTGVPEMYGMVFKNMAESYQYKGLFQEAYEFMRQYNNQLAAFYAYDNVTTIKELEYIFNDHLTKEELAFAHGENRLKELRLRNERQLRTILLSGIAGFLLLSVIIFYLYKKQKKKNLVIRRQADDLQTLVKEVDHRVKNNLQIVSSLLDLQSLIIKDPQAAQAVKEGRNRVQSMALIHQVLYRERNMNGIQVDEYIHNLALNLFHSYNIKPGEVILKANIQKLKLNVDTVLPIGLVINELISNSLKYAFAEGQRGEIVVDLAMDDGVLVLQVKDNGKGFLPAIDYKGLSSFGMRMVRAFAQKLKADLDVFNDGGACVVMKIRKYKLAV